MSFTTPPLPRSTFYDFLLSYGWKLGSWSRNPKVDQLDTFQFGRYFIHMEKAESGHTSFRLYMSDKLMAARMAARITSPVAPYVPTQLLETIPHWEFREHIEEWTIQAKMEFVHLE